VQWWNIQHFTVDLPVLLAAKTAQSQRESMLTTSWTLLQNVIWQEDFDISSQLPTSFVK
jgi:hypothetical protein